MSISEWSETYVFLPAGASAVPGRWRTLPYQLGVMEAAKDSKVNKITLMWGSQLGKTTLLNNMQ